MAPAKKRTAPEQPRTGWKTGKPHGARPAREWVAAALCLDDRPPTVREIVAATGVSRQRAHVLLVEELARAPRSES